MDGKSNYRHAPRPDNCHRAPRPLYSRRERQRERRADARRRLDVDPAAEQLRESLRDVEPETRAAMSPREPGVELRERPEEPTAIVAARCRGRYRATSKRTSRSPPLAVERDLVHASRISPIVGELHRVARPGSRGSAAPCRCRSSCESARRASTSVERSRFCRASGSTIAAAARTRSSARNSVGRHDFAPRLEAREGEHLLDHHRQVVRHRPHALEHVGCGSVSGPMTSSASSSP